MMGAAHENCSRLRETRGLGRINTPAAVGAGRLNSALGKRPGLAELFFFELEQETELTAAFKLVFQQR